MASKAYISRSKVRELANNALQKVTAMKEYYRKRRVKRIRRERKSLLFWIYPMRLWLKELSYEEAEEIEALSYANYWDDSIEKTANSILALCKMTTDEKILLDIDDYEDLTEEIEEVPSDEVGTIQALSLESPPEEGSALDCGSSLVYIEALPGTAHMINFKGMDFLITAIDHVRIATNADVLWITGDLEHDPYFWAEFKVCPERKKFRTTFIRRAKDDQSGYPCSQWHGNMGYTGKGEGPVFEICMPDKHFVVYAKNHMDVKFHGKV